MVPGCFFFFHSLLLLSSERVFTCNLNSKRTLIHILAQFQNKKSISFCLTMTLLVLHARKSLYDQKQTYTHTDKIERNREPQKVKGTKWAPKPSKSLWDLFRFSFFFFGWNEKSNTYNLHTHTHWKTMRRKIVENSEFRQILCTLVAFYFSLSFSLYSTFHKALSCYVQLLTYTCCLWVW